MAYLEEIPLTKAGFLNDLIDNKNIAEYLNRKDIKHPDELINENIFPYPYIPETQDDVKIYICFDIYVPRVMDKMFKDVQIVVNVFAHKDISTYKGKTRVDLLNIEIDKILNGNQDFGIDGVALSSVMPYSPNNKFFGKQLVYNVMNFNQKRCKHNEHKIQ